MEEYVSVKNGKRLIQKLLLVHQFDYIVCLLPILYCSVYSSVQTEKIGSLLSLSGGKGHRIIAQGHMYASMVKATDSLLKVICVPLWWRPQAHFSRPYVCLYPINSRGNILLDFPQSSLMCCGNTQVLLEWVHTGRPAAN